MSIIDRAVPGLARLELPETEKHWLSVCIEGEDTAEIESFLHRVGVANLGDIVLRKGEGDSLEDMAVSYPHFLTILSSRSIGMVQDACESNEGCSLQCLEPLCSWLPWNKDCQIASKIAPKVDLTYKAACV